MGLTQKLGTIPLAIFTDASNNIGIGGAPSGSYKFEVTGTGNFSNTLRAASSSFPIDIYGTTNNYGLRINNVQAATLLLYSSNENSSSRNWGIYTNSEVYGDFDIRQSNAKNGDMTAGANGTSRFYIKNNGFIGIGNNNPGYRLEVTGIIAGKATGNGGRFESIDTITGANLTINPAFNSGEPAIQTQSNSPILFAPNNTDRARITSGGDFLIGKTSVLWTSVGLQTEFGGRNLGITNNDSSNNLFLRKNDTTGTMIQFWYNNNSVGNIGISTTNTTYATTSDYRLKEDLQDFNGLDLVSKIKAYDFKWKSEDKRMYGVIAHELKEIIDYAVVGEKDAKNMQSVDYSLITPLLVKAIQELSAKVSALENKS